MMAQKKKRDRTQIIADIKNVFKEYGELPLGKFMRKVNLCTKQLNDMLNKKILGSRTEGRNRVIYPKINVFS